MKTSVPQQSLCTKKTAWTLPTLVVLLLWSAAGKPAAAQAVYGSIFGTVTDNSGALIPGATVTVTDISKNIPVQTTTNSSGDYRVDHLIPGTYSVQAEAPHFQNAVVPSVVVYADTAPKVNLQLQVGAASSTVQVTTAAPLLTTDRADVSTDSIHVRYRTFPTCNGILRLSSCSHRARHT